MRLAERQAPRWIDHWHAWKQRSREAWAAWKHPQQRQALEALCEQEPWHSLGAQDPELQRKVFAPYPLQGLDVPARTDWLLTHARLAQSLFPPELLRDILLAPRGWSVCDVPLPGGHGRLSLRLMHAALFRHEGDLSLVLHDPWDTPLYTLTFSLHAPQGQTQALIGALQGHLDRTQAAHLTRLCLGLRPPALMLFLMQALAEALSLHGLQAVGAERHVYSGRGMARFIQFDYDGLWAASGGQRQPDALWRLPLPFAERPLAEVPARKRAQYRRRYAWQAELRECLLARVQAARQAAC